MAVVGRGIGKPVDGVRHQIRGKTLRESLNDLEADGVGRQLQIRDRSVRRVANLARLVGVRAGRRRETIVVC
jgi:hypothetical protein